MTTRVLRLLPHLLLLQTSLGYPVYRQNQALCIVSSLESSIAAKDAYPFQSGPVPEFYHPKSIVVDMANTPPMTYLKFYREFLKKADNSKVLFLGVHDWVKQEFAADFRSGHFFDLKLPTDSQWTRDYVPEVVRASDGSLRMVQFQYRVAKLANDVGKKFAERFGIQFYKSPLVLEGGNLLSPGDGRVFVTERVLEENPTLTRESIEAELKSALFAKEIVWLPPEPYEMTGHIDMFAKFLDSKRALVATTENEERKKVLDAVANKLSKMGYQVSRVANADAKTDISKSMSYVNSLIIDQTAFVPSYGTKEWTFDSSGLSPSEWKRLQSMDESATAAYRNFGYDVIPVPAHDTIQQCGTVHCLTKQLPSLVGDPR